MSRWSTLFLDEKSGGAAAARAGEALRVLREEIRPVGRAGWKVDVRVVAAAARPMGKLVEKGEFPRGPVLPPQRGERPVPPLRSAARVLPLLANAFIQHFNRELNRSESPVYLSPEAEAVMATYAWPGNVRELENAMERAVLLADGPHPSGQPARAAAGPAPSSPGTGRNECHRSVVTCRSSGPSATWRVLHPAALRRTGNRTRAAEVLDISHRALLCKIRSTASTGRGGGRPGDDLEDCGPPIDGMRPGPENPGLRDRGGGAGAANPRGSRPGRRAGGLRALFRRVDGQCYAGCLSTESSMAKGKLALGLDIGSTSIKMILLKERAKRGEVGFALQKLRHEAAASGGHLSTAP